MASSSWRRFALCLGLATCVFGPLRLARAQFTLYGAQQGFNVAFYTLDPSTGKTTTVTSQNNAFYAGLDAQPGTGTLYGAAGSFLYTVDPATGQPSSTTALTGDGADDVFSLSFAPDGTLYGLGNGDGNLYVVDPATGDTQARGTSGQFIFGLEFGPDGTLYGCSDDLYVIDPTNGSAVDRGPLVSTGTFALFDDLDFAPNGTLYGVTDSLSGNNTDSLYSIDPATATATLIGATNSDVEAIASLGVPEPRAGLWLALGGAGLAVYARRRAAVRSGRSA